MAFNPRLSRRKEEKMKKESCDWCGCALDAETNGWRCTEGHNHWACDSCEEALEQYHDEYCDPECPDEE